MSSNRLFLLQNPSYSMPMAMNTNQSTSNQLPSLGQHQIYHQMGQQQQTATNNLENFSPKHFSTTNNSSSSNNKVSSSSSQVESESEASSCRLILKCLQGFQGNNNNSTYTQQSSPIPIDTNHQRQQHSPLHHQSYPNNQISADKLMSYRSANTASPANLSSSQGNLSKVCCRGQVGALRFGTIFWKICGNFETLRRLLQFGENFDKI